MPILRGPRLTLRAASVEDLDFFADLNGDAVVMAHVAGRAASRSQTDQEWTRRLGERSAVERGLGYWVGVVDGGPIGWWGVGRTASDPGAGELGFRIQREQWRKGLGSEGAGLVVDHAFREPALARVWAGTVAANVASRRTLEAVGLTEVDEPFPGVLTYEMTRSEWLGRGRARASRR